MTRVYFHTKHEGTVEILGRERAHMGLTCSDITVGLVPQVHDDLLNHYFAARARDSVRSTDARFRDRWVGTMLTVTDDPVFRIGSELLDNFSLVLNTVLAIGNDPLCLFARLHGQCEIHGYVEGPDRAWMAGVIRQGLEVGLYRQGMGWDRLVTLLEQSDAEPVVTSFSVTGGFPNSAVADWTPPEVTGEDDYADAWYDELTSDERWDHAMTGLRAKHDIVSLSADNLHKRFGHGKTLFDVLNQPTVVVL